MAGSLAMLVDDDGRFSMELIENIGDAHEALEECFNVILALTGGKAERVNAALEALNYPTIGTDMVPEHEDDFDGIDDS